jgi:aldose 1-epimerase
MDIQTHTLKTDTGMQVLLSNYGASVLQWLLPNSDGTHTNIVLGFEHPEDYFQPHPYLGATAGRVAGRITNGHYILGEKTYEFEINDPPNHLHDGHTRLDKRYWKIEKAADQSILFRYDSPDGEEGYPGNLTMQTAYHLNADTLTVEYTAETDRPTPFNPTHHGYFNLAGAGTVLNQSIQISAETFVPADDSMTLLADEQPVDFQEPKLLSEWVPSLHKQHGDLYRLKVDKPGAPIHHAATLHEPESGRTLPVETNAIFLQFYSGVGLPAPFKPFGGLCLECQGHPNDCTLEPGTTFRQTTMYRITED